MTGQHPCGPSPLPRFLCDEMLGGLARYLRAAGYDTRFANNGDADRDLLRLCHAEGRCFLTQDRLIREHKAARDIAVILPQGDLDHLAMQVQARFQLDWLAHAFTRCLIDNALLQTADAAAMQRVPADALRPDEPYLHCPACDRVYWRGTHYKRMLARLARWQAGHYRED